MFIDDGELERLPPPRWLVDGMVPAQGVFVLFGESGSGKSFLALDLAFAVQMGGKWIGHRVKRPGTTVYVAAEGFPGYVTRVLAWKRFHGWSGTTFGICFHGDPVDLLDESAVSALIAAAVKLRPRVTLVILDTLPRCMPGGDENSAKDMGAVVRSADMIRKALRCTVMLVHHPGKKNESERGSGALRGGADTVIRVRKSERAVSLHCEKQKDGSPFQPVSVQLHVIQLPCGLDSCVVGPAVPGDPRRDALAPRDLQALEALTGMRGGLRYREWQGTSGLAPRTFDRAREVLLSGGYVQPHGSGYKSTPRGAATAETLPKHRHDSNPPTAATPTPPLGGGGGSGRASGARSKE
jgi:hypothetical protein